MYYPPRTFARADDTSSPFRSSSPLSMHEIQHPLNTVFSDVMTEELRSNIQAACTREQSQVSWAGHAAVQHVGILDTDICSILTGKEHVSDEGKRPHFVWRACVSCVYHSALHGVSRSPRGHFDIFLSCSARSGCVHCYCIYVGNVVARKLTHQSTSATGSSKVNDVQGVA